MFDSAIEWSYCTLLTVDLVMLVGNLSTQNPRVIQWVMIPSHTHSRRAMNQSLRRALFVLRYL